MFGDRVDDLEREVASLRAELERRKKARLPEGYATAFAFTCSVPGQPRGKLRPIPAGFGKRHWLRDNPANGVIEQHIRDHVIKQIPEGLKNVLPWHGPVVLDIRAHYHIQKFRGVAHVSKPDFDNVAKAVCDALNDTLWEDDSQVFDCWVRKEYDRQKPWTYVKVYLLDKL